VADDGPGSDEPSAPATPVALSTIAAAWGRIGCLGFGGPPAHIALLRALCVERHGWIDEATFEHGIAATNVLPGPASTQLAIWCAWRLRRTAGAVVGGLAFILPGLVIILALAALFLQGHPPRWVEGIALGLGAAVAAVALNAALGLVPGSFRRAGGRRPAQVRWAAYLVVGAVSAATLGTLLVVAIVACGLVEWLVRHPPRPDRLASVALPGLVAAVVGAGGVASLVWVAFKVGALSFGGGFVIIPLMQADAVHHYHWMTGGQFLNAVALGQITPGPVVQTVAVVGYAAAGVGGGLLAAAVAFGPSFAFVLVGAPHFDRLRDSAAAQAFLTGAGATALGAIAGSAIPLGLALSHLWQVPILVGAGVWLLGLRRGTVSALVGAGALGLVAALAGAPLG